MLARAVAQRGHDVPQAGGPVLQRYALQQAAVVMGAQFHAQVKQGNGSFRTGAGVVTATGPNTTQLRVSEDGKMAIEDTDLSQRQPKVFYATQAVFNSANRALGRHNSHYRLFVDQTNAITVADAGGVAVRLHRILPKRDISWYKKHTPTTKGMGVTVKDVCDQVASEIVGRDVALLLPKLDKAIGMDPNVTAHEYKVARWLFEKHTINEGAADQHVNVDVIQNAGTRDQIAHDYMQVLINAPVAAAAIAQELGINAFADPRVGQSFGSISMGNPTDQGILDEVTGVRRRPLTPSAAPSGYTRDIWGTHYGAVVAESAGNKVTFENYGRKGEDPTNLAGDPIYYFQMYGPTTNAAQTWHGQWTTGAHPVINPITMVYG